MTMTFKEWSNEINRGTMEMIKKVCGDMSEDCAEIVYHLDCLDDKLETILEKSGKKHEPIAIEFLAKQIRHSVDLYEELIGIPFITTVRNFKTSEKKYL